MENFWLGFEKKAFLQAAMRGLGGASHHLMSGGSSVLQAAKKLPEKARFLPKQLHESFLQGQVNAANAARKAAPGAKKVVQKGKQVAQKGTQVAQQAAAPVAAAPSALSSIRGKGKALLTGGLLGAGGVYATSGDSGQAQQRPY